MAKKRKKQNKKPASKKAQQSRKQAVSRYGSRRALKDLVLFALLSVLSFILYLVSGNTLYQETFYLLGILFASIAVAFLIVFLVIIFARGKVKAKK